MNHPFLVTENLHRLVKFYLSLWSRYRGSSYYEKASLIVTSNKSFLDWGEIFNDHVLATAILDRLLHHSTTLNIKGESYRLKEKRKAGLLGRPAKENTPKEVPIGS